MHEIIVLSDEEFEQRQKEANRQSFLQQLEQMSKSSSSDFSVKNVKKSTHQTAVSNDRSLSDYVKDGPVIDDASWDGFVADLTEPVGMSPIESVTDENISGFQLDADIASDDNKYGNFFKKEIAMLSEVLKDVKSQGSQIKTVLKAMSPGKKGAGVTKGFSDLNDTYNSVNSTKMSVIKAITDLKTKQMDWTFKDKAAQGPDTVTTETLADQYYKNIINGGTKNFIQSAMGGYTHSADFEFDPIDNSQPGDYTDDMEGDPSTIDAAAMSTGFNISQPINAGQRQSYNAQGNGDDFGYIAHENQDYDICVYQYGENHFEFVALDEDGVPIPGIELPSDSDPTILASLKVRPGSNYIYDKYGRKYALIEQNGVDISDIDNMEYPYDSDEDR